MRGHIGLPRLAVFTLVLSQVRAKSRDHHCSSWNAWTACAFYFVSNAATFILRGCRDSRFARRRVFAPCGLVHGARYKEERRLWPRKNQLLGPIMSRRRRPPSFPFALFLLRSPSRRCASVHGSSLLRSPQRRLFFRSDVCLMPVLLCRRNACTRGI